MGYNRTKNQQTPHYRWGTRFAHNPDSLLMDRTPLYKIKAQVLDAVNAARNAFGLPMLANLPSKSVQQGDPVSQCLRDIPGIRGIAILNQVTIVNAHSARTLGKVWQSRVYQCDGRWHGTFFVNVPHCVRVYIYRMYNMKRWDYRLSIEREINLARAACAIPILSSIYSIRDMVLASNHGMSYEQLMGFYFESKVVFAALHGTGVMQLYKEWIEFPTTSEQAARKISAAWGTTIMRSSTGTVLVRLPHRIRERLCEKS